MQQHRIRYASLSPFACLIDTGSCHRRGAPPAVHSRLIIIVIYTCWIIFHHSTTCLLTAERRDRDDVHHLHGVTGRFHIATRHRTFGDKASRHTQTQKTRDCHEESLQCNQEICPGVCRLGIGHFCIHVRRVKNRQNCANCHRTSRRLSRCFFFA